MLLRFFFRRLATGLLVGAALLATDGCQHKDEIAPAAKQARSQDVVTPTVVYRFRNVQTNRHAYSQNPSAFSSPWVREKPAFAAFNLINDYDQQGTVPLYGYVRYNLVGLNVNAEYMYTISSVEDNALQGLGFWRYGVLAYVWDRKVANLVPLYRLYNNAIGDHFFTVDSYEAQVAKANGYSPELDACWVGLP